MTADAVCLVFAKPPRPGVAKTRLAASIGAERAAALAAALLFDTVERLQRHRWLRVVVSTPDPRADHGVDVERWDQGGGDLGQRLERGLGRGLAAHSVAVAVGADAPHLPDEHLGFLRDHLGSAPLLGPTEDGGFWALMVDRCPADTLAGIPWSTPHTASATMRRLEERLRPPAVAPSWWDIDVLADLGRLLREIPRDRAPRTHDAARALGATLARSP